MVDLFDAVYGRRYYASCISCPFSAGVETTQLWMLSALVAWNADGRRGAAFNRKETGILSVESFHFLPEMAESNSKAVGYELRKHCVEFAIDVFSHIVAFVQKPCGTVLAEVGETLAGCPEATACGIENSLFYILLESKKSQGTVFVILGYVVGRDGDSNSAVGVG